MQGNKLRAGKQARKPGAAEGTAGLEMQTLLLTAFRRMVITGCRCGASCRPMCCTTAWREGGLQWQQQVGG